VADRGDNSSRDECGPITAGQAAQGERISTDASGAINTTAATATDDVIDSVIDTAIDDCIHRYFNACRGRVPEFVRRHFHYPGAWQTNRRAFGWDLLRSPLNLLWAPFYTLAALVRVGSRKLGCRQFAARLDRLPSGMKTEVQRYVATKIYAELLHCPATSRHTTDVQVATGEKLVRIPVFLKDTLEGLDPQSTQYRRLVELNAQLGVLNREAIDEINLTRTATADIANSTLAVLIGAVCFNKFVVGGIALGVLLAAWFAREAAISKFWFGDLPGSWYYTVFPPDPSPIIVLLSILLVVVVLALLCAFWGLLTDPLQAAAGLHGKRLYRLIDKLEQDLKHHTRGGFRPKDQYFARILEVIDAIRSPFV